MLSSKNFDICKDSKNFTKNKQGERVGMKRIYEELVLDVVLITEDAVRCSNVYSAGDDTSDDIFD